MRRGITLKIIFDMQYGQRLLVEKTYLNNIQLTLWVWWESLSQLWGGCHGVIMVVMGFESHKLPVIEFVTQWCTVTSRSTNTRHYLDNAVPLHSAPNPWRGCICPILVWPELLHTNPIQFLLHARTVHPPLSLCSLRMFSPKPHKYFFRCASHQARAELSRTEDNRGYLI